MLEGTRAIHSIVLLIGHEMGFTIYTHHIPSFVNKGSTIRKRGISVFYGILINYVCPIPPRKV